MVEPIAHLADFLGAELRRRYEEFDRKRVMQCHECNHVVLVLAKTYGLHWDRKKRRFLEEIP